MRTANQLKLDVAPLLDYLDKIGGVKAAPGLTGFQRVVDIEDSLGVICPTIVHEKTVEEMRAHKAALDTIKKPRARGWIDLFVADAFCCEVLRVHPSVVWGDAFYTAGEDDETLEAAA